MNNDRRRFFPVADCSIRVFSDLRIGEQRNLHSPRTIEPGQAKVLPCELNKFPFPRVSRSFRELDGINKLALQALAGFPSNEPFNGTGDL